MTGQAISDKTYRVTLDDEPVIQMCLLGTFSPYVTVNEASVIKIEKDIPLDKAALLGCGVATGWGGSPPRSVEPRSATRWWSSASAASESTRCRVRRPPEHDL